jgi:hypothetical protein
LKCSAEAGLSLSCTIGAAPLVQPHGPVSAGQKNDKMKSKSNKNHIFGILNQVPMPKRIYFETTETTVKNKKGYIEVDTDFTQVYDCFSRISVKLRSITSVKLLFWLLSHEANKNNGISSGRQVYERFIKYLKSQKAEIVAERTFKSAFEELTDIKALTRVGRGQYYLNPYVFWRDDKAERISFITDEQKEKRYLSYNPIKDDKNQTP